LIVERGIPLIIRIPLIPEHTDSEENITALVQFVGSLAGVTAVNLLPIIGRIEQVRDARPGVRVARHGPASYERVEAIAKRFETLAVDCEIVT